MRWLLLLLLTSLAWAEIPWGEGVVLTPGKSEKGLTVVSTGEDSVTVKADGVAQTLKVGASAYLGDYRVGLDTLREGRALLKWARAPRFESAAATLKPYGWEPRGEASIIPFEVPKELGGPAFTHYQSASQALELDLRQVAGRTIELKKQSLSVKTGSGYPMYAFLAVADGRLVGAWIASDAPIAPGISPLNSRQPLKW